MPCRLAILFSICVVSFFIVPLKAQLDDIVTRKYSRKDGLSYESVYCMLQDHQGMLWIGTYSGLNKFDGYNFTNYFNNPSDSNSLVDDNVKCLLQYDSIRILIGTSKGLQLYDLKTEKFYHFKPESEIPISTFEFSIPSVKKGKDGSIWVCTGQGIYKADPDRLTLKKEIYLDHEPNGNDLNREKILKNIFLDVVETREGDLWLATRKGLIKKDVGTNQLTQYQHDPEDPHSISHDNILTVFLDSQHRLWAGTGYGINLYNASDHSFENYLPESFPSDYSVEPFFRVFSILENRDGKFWVGSNHGLYLFDPRTRKFQLKLDESIQSMMVDQQGILWVGTITGLFQIELNGPKFKIYHQFDQREISLARVLGEDVNNHIWVAGPGLFRFDPSSDKFYQYLANAGNQSYSGYPINDVIPGKDNIAWLASYFGLEKFDPQRQTFTRISIPVNPNVLLKTSRENLFIGGRSESGVYHLQTGEFERITAFPITTVRSLLEDEDGNIWAGTDAGLIKYNLETGDFDIYKNNPNDSKSLSSNIVYDLMMDQQGRLWLATGRGLSLMTTLPGEETPQFIHWTTANSQLPDNVVWSVIDGGEGIIWISCGNQISRFIPGSNSFQNYNSHDGLNGATVYFGLKSKTGEHFYSSKDGLIRFFPDNITDNSYIPPVVITKFSIRNQPVPVKESFGDTLAWKTPLAGIISYSDEIELSYRQNDFSFEFAALNYLNPQNNLYKFRLEPYEHNWIETNADNRVARYTNISPGRYTFRVIGSNNNGLWNETGASLNIVVTPPWWLTWWAFILYGVTVIGIFLYWRSYETRRVKLKHRAEHLDELDRLKSRFFTNVSHEFRTPLTLILGPLSKLLDKNKLSDDKPILQGIQRNAHHLLRLVNQLLNLSKLEAGKLKLTAVKGDMVVYLKVLTDAFISLAEDKNIRFLVELPEEKIETYFDKDKLAEIINNLLSNAFKFTPVDGAICVNMKGVPYRAKGGIQIQIRDTGEGIPKEQVSRIFDRFHQVEPSHKREGTGIGLALTKELVELHYGSISVESTLGEGSRFTVVLPLGKDHLKEEEMPRERSEPKEITASPGQWMNSMEHATPESETVPNKYNKSKPVVLIAEDHQEMRRFIGESIGDNYSIKEAENGLVALEMSRELVPDLIISDVMMPEMDGYRLCQKIKTDELTSHIPVILLTAKSDHKSKLAGLDIGADDYLTKPFHGDELRLIVRNRIEERNRLRERFSREITIQPNAIAVTPLDERFLNKVMTIIEDHMDDESFSIESLSQKAGYSHMQFYRKIKALANQTPSQFLRTIRLKRAAELLGNKSDQVTQIAYSVGFSSATYFSKCFKDHFGMTPGQFMESEQVAK